MLTDILKAKNKQLKERIAELEKELEQVKAERNALSEAIKILREGYKENPTD